MFRDRLHAAGRADRLRLGDRGGPADGHTQGDEHLRRHGRRRRQELQGHRVALRRHDLVRSMRRPCRRVTGPAHRQLHRADRVRRRERQRYCQRPRQSRQRPFGCPGVRRRDLGLRRCAQARSHPRGRVLRSWHRLSDEAGPRQGDRGLRSRHRPQFKIRGCLRQPRRRQRGNVYLEMGEPGFAMDDYDEAIRRAPGDVSGYRSRGYLHFYLGDFARAADDLARVVTSERDDLYAMLWAYLAAARTDAESARRNLAQTATRKGPAWPYPAVELFLGGRTFESTLSAAGNPSECCEAQFYGGEWQLLQGDGAAAATALTAAADTCP